MPRSPQHSASHSLPDPLAPAPFKFTSSSAGQNEVGPVKAMLITQHSYWLHAPLRTSSSFALLESCGSCRFLRLTGRTDGAADGQEGGGGDRSASLPHPQTQPGVCSRTPTTWPFHQPWQDSLSQWETVLSLSLPGAAKSDKAWGPPQGLAWLPPTS